MEREEIVVTVGGEVCTEIRSDTDDINTVSTLQNIQGCFNVILVTSSV